MITDDFYSGFEGEPELQFTFTEDNNSKQISLWSGYFDAIMEAIKPSKTGWTSLAYYYQLNEGWYESQNWVIPDLAEAIDQIDSVILQNKKDEEVRKALSVFLHRALNAKVPVEINYF